MTTNQDRQRLAIGRHIAEFQSSRRRHPLDVTATRLGEHLIKYRDRLSGSEADDFSHVIQILDEIAEGDR